MKLDRDTWWAMTKAPDAKWWPLEFSEAWNSDTKYLDLVVDDLICWVSRKRSRANPRSFDAYRVYYYWERGQVLHEADSVDCATLLDVRATLLAISELTFGSTL
jgi:hypothetical protein